MKWRIQDILPLHQIDQDAESGFTTESKNKKESILWSDYQTSFNKFDKRDEKERQ